MVSQCKGYNGVKIRPDIYTQYRQLKISTKQQWCKNQGKAIVNQTKGNLEKNVHNTIQNTEY